jgi:hypothetical protein
MLMASLIRWRAASRKKGEIDSRLSNGWSVGRLVDGSHLEKVLTWPSSLRDTPFVRSEDLVPFPLESTSGPARDGVIHVME